MLNASGAAYPSFETINNVSVGDIIIVASSITNMEPQQNQTRIIAQSTGLEFISYARSGSSGNQGYCITYRVTADNPTAKTGQYVGTYVYKLT